MLESMGKSKVTKAWNQYETCLKFKKKIKLLQKCENNEKFYSGNQWFGINAKDLPKTQINFIKQISDYKQSQILSEDLTFLFTPQDYTTEDSDGKSKDNQLKKSYDAFNAFAESLKNNINQNQINTDVIDSAKLTGGGGAFYYWDNSVKLGNKVLAIGDVRANILDSSNYFPCDVNNKDAQSQEYIIISGRENVAKLRREAKENGVSETDIKKIVSDEDVDNEAFEYSKINQDDGKKATILIKMWRDYDTNTIHFSKCTKLIEIKKDTDTELEIYPVAWINWEVKKASAFGISEVETLINNQVSLNKMLAFTIRNHALTGYPKMLINRAKVVGGINNNIGGIISVNTDDVRGAVQYLQPPTSSGETYRLFETLLNETKNSVGANENALGESPAQNASAIIALQKQSGIPLENIRRNYRQYLTQVARIYEHFFKVYYTETRGVVVEDKKNKKKLMMKFKGSEFQDINFNVDIDIGVGSRFSEILVMEQLQMLKGSGDITTEQYLEYIPKNVLPSKERILEDLKDSNELNQVEDEMIKSILQQLPEEEVTSLQEIEDVNEFKAEVLSRGLELLQPQQPQPMAQPIGEINPTMANQPLEGVPQVPML